MAEAAVLMILAAVLPTVMKTAVEVAPEAARMTGELPPTSTLVVEVAVLLAMVAAVDMVIHTVVAAAEVTGWLAFCCWPSPLNQIF